MSVNNYAVIDTVHSSSVVVNVIAWDGISDYDVHDGHGVSDGLILVQSDIAGIGWTYLNGQFNNPNIGQE